MIPVVTDSAIAALPENHASDSSRRTASSVDKFSEHLHKAKVARSKQSQSHAERSAPQPSAPFRTMTKQEPAQRDQKVDQEEETRRSDTGAEQGLNVEVTPERVDENAEDQGASLTANLSSPVAILPVPNSTQETLLNSSEVHECGYFDGGMATPLENSTAGPVNDSNVGATKLTVTIQVAATTPSALPPQDEETVSVAISHEGPVETGLSAAGVTTDSVGEAASAPEVISPAASTSLATPASSTEFQSVALPTVVESNVVEVSADPSETGEDSQAKHGVTKSFGQYLFGEGMTRSAVAPGPDARLGAATEAATEAVDSPIENADQGKEETRGKEEVSVRTDSPTLLTPADAAQAAASTLPLSLKRHLETQSANVHGAPAAPVLNDPQHARLLQRVSRAFRAAEERGGQIQIRLSPPELGSMKLELSLASGVMTAKLEVETQRAQSILLDSLPALRERLAEQGIRVEKFDVNLPQRDSSGQQSPQQHQHSQTERQARSAAGPLRREREGTPSENRPSQRVAADASRLNVIV